MFRARAILPPQDRKPERVLREAQVDVIIVTLNFDDHHTYGFDRTVLPLAAERNVGVAAMKVYGGAEAMEYRTGEDEDGRPSALEANARDFDHERAFRWALGLLGVGVAVIGMYSEKELDHNIEWARRWQPLTAEEEAQLLEEGRRIARSWGDHYGDLV